MLIFVIIGNYLELRFDEYIVTTEIKKEAL